MHIKSLGSRTDRADPKYLVAWVHGAQLHLAHGNIADGFAKLGLATEAAATVNLAVHHGHACAAYHPAAAAEDRHEVVVECSACTAKNCNTWHSLGVAIEAAAVVERLDVEVVMTDDGKVVVAGRKVGSPNVLAVRWHEVPPALTPTPHADAPVVGAWRSTGNSTMSVSAHGWTQADLKLENTITHFELGSSGNAVCVVISENGGEGIRVMQVAL